MAEASLWQVGKGWWTTGLGRIFFILQVNILIFFKITKK
jgi:hypothetical protein